jgi:cytosine/adenosine deaminase-related metal-dependent hydrolase
VTDGPVAADGPVASDASDVIDATSELDAASAIDATSSLDAAVPDAAVDGGSDGANDPTIVLGASDRILLMGALVTPDVTMDGAVLIEGNLITCVASREACAAMPGAVGATTIDTKGVISPGLVDTHNHILFDIFNDDDWYPTQIYLDHDQWPNEARYKAMLDIKQCLVNDSQGKPDWCMQTPYGTAAGSLRCEVDKWGELKGLIAGTTSIVGLPGTTAGCFSSLARSIDSPQNGLGQDKVQTSALFPPSGPSTVCQNFTSGKTDAYIVHVGEGTDPKALAEFAKLGTITTPPGCLYAPQTAITHATAFTATEFTAMAQAGMKLVWSPRSNVSLYGLTTDIPAALDAGVSVALAPDWSMGGSQNMLDEMRFADAWDNTHWSDRLSPKDLVEMGTSHGAKVLALDGKLGTLEVGHLADIAVFRGDVAAPYAAIVAARPKDVRLVMVNGVVLYGDSVLQAAGPALPGCEAIDICGVSKFLCAATSTAASKLDQTYAQIQTALAQALVLADSLTPSDGFNFAPVAPIVTCE